MADKKISELTQLDAVLAQTDLLVVVDDPAGTPVTKKLEKRDLITRYAQLQPFSMKDSEPCSTGDGKGYLHVPPDLNGLDLVYCHAEVRVAGTTSTMQIQIRNVTQAADMLSVKLSIDSGETGSDTAATGYTINTSEDDVSTNDVLRLDFDAKHTTPAQGCLVTLGFG